MDKIYWRNLLWNHTIRFWYLWKYKHSPWKGFFCTSRYWSFKTKQNITNAMGKAMDKFIQEHTE